MREAIRDRNRLQHMLEAIDVIAQRTAKMTFEDLTTDKVLRPDFGGFNIFMYPTCLKAR